jgi:predicted Ser/Thr protein kinase
MPALESLPRKIGPYRVFGKIGEGGMGVVYLARDAEGRQVAVKVLGPAVAADPDARLRLAREVETMRRVRSPHVAEVVDACITGPSPYIVTRYVPGPTLDAMVRDIGPLSGAALDQVAAGLAAALAAIHAAGVIHRDLKPGNVLLDDGQPVVIDFGIAHIPDSTRLTRTGLVMGTPGYLAPEVIEGHSSSGASDVHAWGATVAYAATGRPPYGSGGYQTIFFRVLHGGADLAGVPPQLLPLVAAALSLDPAARPPAYWLAECCTQPFMNGLEYAGPHADGTLLDGTMLDGTMLDGTRLDGTRLDGTRLDGTRLDGTRLDEAAWRPPVPAPYTPYAPIAPVAWHPAGPSPAEAAAGVADLLPPVEYARPAAAHRVSAPQAAAPALVVPPTAPPATGYGAISLAFGTAAVALSVLLPVAGTALALAVITLLRAVDRGQAGLAARRSVRGARPSDILIVIVTAPWTVVRAVLTTVMLAPLAIVVGAAAAAASVALTRAGTLPAAGSWAAGAAVAWYCVGPGSRAPRRQLRRMSASVISSRAGMLVGLISSWALALAVISSAVSQPALIWPATSSTLPHLLPSLNMLPSLGGVLHTVQGWILRHTVGMLHLP